MSTPVSEMTANAVVTSMPSMRVRSTPHISEQLRTQVKLRRVASPAALLALGRFALVSLQALQLLLDLALPLLAVNLSGTSLNEQSFIDWVLQQVGDATLAQALCFEITETAAVTNLSNATFAMRELKARGCKFALDDFGTGLSSFMYLKTLPVDYLKIDGQFISHVADDPVDHSMVEAICKVGRALGIETVADCGSNLPGRAR